jgi:hypothetical protein
MNIHAWQARNDNVWVVDQQELNEQLNRLEMNWQRLTETLSSCF